MAAQNPTVRSFTDRLAWLVVVHTDSAAFDCTESSRPARMVPLRASDHGYEVFMIDARTGTDAIVYREGGRVGAQAAAACPQRLGGRRVGLGALDPRLT